MKRILALMLIVGVGVGVLQFAPAMAWITSARHRGELLGYSRQVETLTDTEVHGLLEAAEQYNARLASGQQPLADNEADDAEYNALLTVPDTAIMGRVSIPSIGANLPIYHGTDDSILELGAGHLYGSSLPVGGPSTHAVISAHSGIVRAEMFTKLDRVVEGDTFTVEVAGRVMRYTVDHIDVVEPEDIDDIAIEDGKDYVTLITCTPIGINTHRLLVRGVRTPELAFTGGADDALSFWEYPGFPWWAAIFGGSLMVAFGVGKVATAGVPTSASAAGAAAGARRRRGVGVTPELAPVLADVATEPIVSEPLVECAPPTTLVVHAQPTTPVVGERAFATYAAHGADPAVHTQNAARPRRNRGELREPAADVPRRRDLHRAAPTGDIAGVAERVAPIVRTLAVRREGGITCLA